MPKRTLWNGKVCLVCATFGASGLGRPFFEIPGTLRPLGGAETEDGLDCLKCFQALVVRSTRFFVMLFGPGASVDALGRCKSEKSFSSLSRVLLRRSTV